MRVIPWAMTAGLVAWVMIANEVPALDLLRYGAYVVLGLALPGTLLLRALVGPRRSLLEDATLGTVFACAVELLVFVVASRLGVQESLRWWPLIVLVAFAGVPRLRQHWRRRPDAGGNHLPQLWHWGVSSAAVLGIVRATRLLGAYRLPPSDGSYYVDLLWHLGIVHSLTRSVPPEIPQVSGEILRYHWFSHAQMAAAHLVSGVPEAAILMRLWPALFTLLAVLAAATLARELSGVWWTGPLAGWIIAVVGVAQILPVTADVNALSLLSFSQSYVVVIALAAATLAVRALRGEHLGRGWVVLVGMVALASGSKPTAVPLLLAGSLTVLLVSVVVNRAWVRPALRLVAICAVILPVSSRLLTGSDSGSTISFFDFMEWVPLYHDLTGAPFLPSRGPLLPEGVADLSVRSVQVLGLVVLTQLVPLSAVILSSLTFRHRTVRGDPAAWFLLGLIGAGLAVYLTLSHPALSQLYFLSLAVAFFGPVLAWVTASAVQRVPPRPRTRLLVVTVGTALGWATAFAAHRLTPVVTGPAVHDVGPWAAALLVPLAVVAFVIVAGGVAVLTARRQRGLPRHVGVAMLVVGCCLGAPLEGVAPVFSAHMVALVRGEEVPAAQSGLPLPSGGGAALDWLNTHTPGDAVVATNRHCDVGVERNGCRALAFYVSGLGGRQVVIEGWGYTNPAGGLQVETRWPERLAVNDRLFTDPSAGDFTQLKAQFGLGWLVADASAGPVSPLITEFAVPRFQAGSVTVYEVRR